ncbi:MAG: alpha/beta fold hydrolase [Gammaproteobacteria bacterium]
MSSTPPPVIVEGAGEVTAAVIWLHGLGADGHDFEPIVAELDLPPGHGIRFVFPHAPVRPITINRGMAMRGWYDVAANDLTRLEDEAGIRDSARILNEHVAAQRARGIDNRRIVVAGFSQGGAIALFAGLRHQEPLGGIMALSTYLPLPMTLTAEANPANVDVPIFMAHGSFDPIIPAHQGDASAKLLKTSGYKVEWRSYPMPHSVCEEEVADISRWLRQRLPA